ncbi:class II aldolase/adducin family protein, partial [Parasedimentitalea maritima]
MSARDVNRLREQIATYGKSLFDRGLTMGSSGNISVRLDDGGWLMTPTNACLGRLDPASISTLSATGEWLDG